MVKKLDTPVEKQQKAFKLTEVLIDLLAIVLIIGKDKMS